MLRLIPDGFIGSTYGFFDNATESPNSVVNGWQNGVLDSVDYLTGGTLMIAAEQAFCNIFDMAFPSSQMDELVDKPLGSNKSDFKATNQRMRLLAVRY